MSHETFNEKWRETQEELSATLQLEPTQADRRDQRNLLALLYVRYVGIANRLAECDDQMVQSQKRRLVRKLLEATLGRILELKNDLVEADLCEWTHYGEVYQQLKLTPPDSELKVPTCFRNERQEEIDSRQAVIENVLGKLGFLEKPVEKVPMTEQQAILIIQTHERARQGRVRAQFMKEIHGMKEKTKPAPDVAGLDEEGVKSLSFAAALRIQKVWRGYVARKITRRRKHREMLLIGMIPPEKKITEEIEKAEEVKKTRRQLQKKRQLEYEDAINNCREKLEKYERGVVLEHLSDQVRGWLQEYKTQTGKIPEYTGPERSGSRLVLSRQGTDSDLSKSSPGSSKESKPKRSSKGTKSKESKSEVDEDENVSKATVSVFVPELIVRKEEYDETWKLKDESNNPHQVHYDEIIVHEQMTHMENELRKIVDDMMRAELQLLQEAYDKDRGHKGKKFKKASKKMRGKKGKKKKEKDLTPDRTTESLFEELAANGIIRRYPKINMDDFLGERSYNPPVPYNRGKEQKNSLGDVRQLLTEYCVIPLLTPKLHESTPHIKSLLLVGAKGSGKDMLIRAICSEVGAILFDLTPANIVGKYPGKSGLIMLIHLVTKVARLLQPSIIYMDCAERPFVKKIPKTDKTDPKRLKKDLAKIVKNLSPEDRVMLIGASSCPWDSDQKLLQQVYQKYIIIPKPDYSSRFCVWRETLGKFAAMSWKFDFSVMSRISDSFTIGSIISSIDEVMTVKRVLQLRVHPLSPLEMVNAMCKRTPVYKEEDEAMETWYAKTPMCKRRLRAIEMRETEEAEFQAKQANAKMKKQITAI